jgi:chromosome segregation ATPase
MPDTTTTDLAALEAEIDALIAAGAEQGARVDALLRSTGSAAVRLADLQVVAQHHATELDRIERQQRALDRQLTALERDA